MRSGRAHSLAGRFATVVYPALRVISQLQEVGGRIRAKRRFDSCGSEVRFSFRDSEISFEQISVGDNVFIGRRAYFSGPCRIGSNVMFGPEVQLMAGYHRFDLVGSRIMDSGGDERKTIVIEDDVWIGARSTVMKGITIGEGAVVATGSMVLRDVAPYTVATGNPATVRRPRFSDEDLRRHLVMLGQSEEQADRMVRRRAAEYVQAEPDRIGDPDDEPE